MGFFMTDKEFRKLKRSDLISIIYEYQKKQDELNAEIDELKKQLEAKQLRIEKAGSLAEAVVGLNQLFETAQKTADDYLEQLRGYEEDAKKKAAEIIREAEGKARVITAKRLVLKSKKQKKDDTCPVEKEERAADGSKKEESIENAFQGTGGDRAQEDQL